uniref:Uncharacterized protein n=1 Tax=Gossypium raimondii TaxID=29730 RepID=A0A0D2QNG0_GOSRA|nr:hypothetical protein B456_003G050000 [Gossypium raimondii]
MWIRLNADVKFQQGREGDELLERFTNLKGKEKVDDLDCSWLSLLNGVEASTSSESKKLQKLNQMVFPKFVARLVTEMENKKMIKKEGLKSCHEAGVEEGKQDYLIDKQKKQKTSIDRKKK